MVREVVKYSDPTFTTKKNPGRFVGGIGFFHGLPRSRVAIGGSLV